VVLKPAAPVITGVTGRAGNVAVRWTAAGKADGFKVYRSGDDVRFELLGTAAGDEGAYTDTGVTAGVWYYRVIAYNSGGESLHSNSYRVAVTDAPAGVSLSVSNSAGFASALASIQGNTRDTSFTITATADFTLDPQDLSGAAYQNKTITIKGDTPGRTISLNSVGSLFTVGTDVALEVEDITLQGRSDNNAALVTVNTDGRLALNTGGKITGNTYTTSTRDTGGAGVYVDGGTLEIAGGEVSGNTLTGTTGEARGGGAYILNGGAVTMTGGAIRDNRVTNTYSGDTTGSGGGIYLLNSSFEMSGGLIEGNTITVRSTSMGGFSGGGGVSHYGGTFRLISGTIRNNTCDATSANNYGIALGGGVSIGGNFIMEGGVISGNRCTSSINPNKSYGGGKYYDGAYGGGVYLGADMTKTGGVVYGNEVSGNDADGYPLANTVQSDNSGLGGGHALFMANTSFTTHPRRNATAYAGDNMTCDINNNTGTGWE
jgi:hypothetical protein